MSWNHASYAKDNASFPKHVVAFSLEKLGGPAVSELWRAIAQVKQRWSVIGWVTKNLLSRAPPCFGRHVKLLVPAAFAVVNIHQLALGLRGGLWPVVLMCNSFNSGRPVPQQWGH
jgi:hypothetical protein